MTPFPDYSPTINPNTIPIENPNAKAPFGYIQARWRLRILAGLVDYVILWVISMSWFFFRLISSFEEFILGMMASQSDPSFNFWSFASVNSDFLINGFSLMLFQGSYFVLQEWLTGKTLGKRLLRLRVQSTISAENKITLGQAVLRDVGRIIDFYIIILIAIFNRHGLLRQRIGDLLASTIVVIDKD